MGLTRDSFRDIDDRTEDLRDLVEENPDIWSEFITNFELSWVYHENALEGIVLTHAELTSALRGRPIAPETYHDIRNMALGIDLLANSSTVTRVTAPTRIPTMTASAIKHKFAVSNLTSGR